MKNMNFVHVVAETAMDQMKINLHNMMVTNNDQVLACQACGAVTLHNGYLAAQFIADIRRCPNCKAKMEIC